MADKITDAYESSFVCVLRNLLQYFPLVGKGSNPCTYRLVSATAYM